MIIRTESGSVYEIEHEQSRARRLSGLTPPTPRQGQDRDWRTYRQVSGVLLGCPVFFVWADESVGPAAALGSLPGTQTSRVVAIEAA